MTTRSGEISFGEWLPDLPDFNNPGALDARNCIPEIQSYRDLPSLGAFSSALNAPALGAVWLQGSDNTIYNFAGDAGDLYRLTGNNTVWTSISNPSGYTSVSNWEFAKFGDRVIAVDAVNPPQYYDVGTAQATFLDLPGSPPDAARIAVVRDFVVLGDLDIGPNFIQWSGFNNSELWTPSRATQSDTQELFGRGGRIQKIIPGEYGVIVQEHSIHRMDYIGPPVIFQFDEVERGRGTPAPNSVVWTGNLVFYYGHDGFYRFNGQYSEPIGANRVNRWFAANSDPASLSSMNGVIDRRNRVVMWAFKASSTAPINNRIIIFNWAANKWSYGEIETEFLAEYVTSGLTLDELDPFYPGGIDGSNQLSLDSESYQGGALSLQAFDALHRSATFDGPPMPAQFETKEITGSDNRMISTNSIRPIVHGSDATDVTVQLGSRSNSRVNRNYSLPRTLNPIGEANIRRKSRYQTYRIIVNGGFTHAIGVKPNSRTRTSRR